MTRIHKVMSTRPELVGGRGRFCTTLMQAYRGMLNGKVGADGCYGVGIRTSPGDPVEDDSEGRALGIALKVKDGNLNILYSAVVEILEQLKIGTSEM